LSDYYGNPIPNPNPNNPGAFLTNADGYMQYDLLRNAYYIPPVPDAACSSPPCQAVCQQFPPFTTSFQQCLSNNSASNMRNYIAWQWVATAGVIGGGDTDGGADPMIGLNPSNNEFPNWDIDGRLKEVTIYAIHPGNGSVSVDYEDPQGGDIDSSWDTNSCGPKPGMQSSSEIFTFTQNGTYLEIKEGNLYNPETGLEVRSASKRDTIDLIQRTIQLSNNTGRFCSSDNIPLQCVGQECSNGSWNCPFSERVACAANAAPNPVEACGQTAASTNGAQTQSFCFTKTTLPMTCFDSASNILFVRSRLQDQRGHFWMTDTSGQLGVK